MWLTTRDGRQILDLYGGHAVAALGYGHAGWTAALTSQAAACNFQSNAVPMAVRARAAQRLVHFSQLPFERVFFVNSGAEANENALKLAFRVTQRTQDRRRRRQLSWAHRRRGRHHLGRAAQMVWFSAYAV